MQPTFKKIYYLFYSLLLIIILSINTQLKAQNYFPVKLNQKWGMMNAMGKLVVPTSYEVIGAPQKFGYTLMQKDNKIGMMDKLGKILLGTKYDEIKIIAKNFIEVTENGESKIVNIKGKLVLKGEGFGQFKAISSDFLLFSSSRKYGLVDANGEIIIKPLYDDIAFFQDSFFKIKNNHQFGLASLNGQFILPIKNDEIKLVNKELIFYLKGVLWGAVDNNGQKVIPVNYNDYTILNPSLLKLERFGAHWLYNVKQKRIVSSRPVQDFLPFSDHYILTKQGINFGLVDYTATEILPSQYDEIQSFSATAFRVRNGCKWGVINNKNLQILDFDYDFIAPVRNGRTLIKKGSLFGLINAEGKVIVPPEYNKITLSEDKIKAFKGKKWTLFYIDENGKAQKGGNFKNHFTIKIEGNSIKTPLNRLNQDGFDNSYLLDKFEWFYNSELRKWGLRQLSDGQIVIEPTYNNIQIERDLGYTIVGLEKQGQYRFDRTNYRFNYLYGIVNNEVGKLVTRLVFMGYSLGRF